MTADLWTTRKLLHWTTERFEQAGLDFTRRRAETLLAHVLDCDRLRLYMEADRPASPDELAQFRSLIQRALAHEPIDYLVGHAPFFGLVFQVNSHTLIPRPATETLVSFALDRATDITSSLEDEPLRIADVGTGSGIIPIALSAHLTKRQSSHHIHASDISAEALTVARKNAQHHKVTEQIQFSQGNLLEPHKDQCYHLLLSNPPYIPDHEWDALAPHVKNHEPTTALRGGQDGLELIRPLIATAPEHLHPGGWLALETASCTTEATAQLLDDASFTHVQILSDHEDLPRVVIGQKP